MVYQPTVVIRESPTAFDEVVAGIARRQTVRRHVRVWATRAAALAWSAMMYSRGEGAVALLLHLARHDLEVPVLDGRTLTDQGFGHNAEASSPHHRISTPKMRRTCSRVAVGFCCVVIQARPKRSHSTLR